MKVTHLLKCLDFNAVIRRVKGCVNIKLMAIKKVDVFSTPVADTFNENMHSSPSGSSRRFPLWSWSTIGCLLQTTIRWTLTLLLSDGSIIFLTLWWHDLIPLQEGNYASVHTVPPYSIWVTSIRATCQWFPHSDRSDYLWEDGEAADTRVKHSSASGVCNPCSRT